MPLRILSLVAVAAAAVVALAWLGLHRTPPLPARPSDPDLRSAARVAELARMRRAVGALERLAKARTLASVPPPDASAGPAAARPPRFTRERKDPFTAALEERFSHEKPDAAWAAPRAAAIKAAFATLPDVSVVSVSCAATLCRAILRHPDAESQRQTLDLVGEVPDLDTETMFTFDKRATPPRTIAYIAREGHELPRGR
jgi:hypothetical protein